MKKYHLYLWLIALMGLFAACSQDETADALQTANESNRVTLTASLPADFAQPGTRANEVPAFPTDHKLRCILEVWDEQLTTLKVRKEVCPSAGAAKIDFTFELDNGKYNALLWADYISESAGASTKTIAGLSGVEHYTDAYYMTDNAAGLKEVQVVSMLPDFESRDAFCAAKPFTKEAAALKDLTATLTRPLTKLTIAEKNATNFGYCRAVLTRYSVPDKLNVSTGTVSGSEPIVLTYNSGVPGFGDDITVNDTPCKVLFSNYIFAEADGTMPEIKLEFTATTESGKVLPNVTIPAGIPVKRNHRINAAGNLITAQDVPSKAVNMSVDINSGWAESEENKDIASTVWDGTYPASEAQAKEWLGSESEGAGDEDGRKRVFTITTARQLAALHYLVANYVEMANAMSNIGYTNATYKLAADINLNNHPWAPIGYKVNFASFAGIFDGQSHTIRGMNITGDYASSGFFAIVAGVVKHLNVKGTVAPVFSNWSDAYCGGIAGYLYGRDACIAFCSFEGTITGTLDNPIFAGGIAGIVGYSNNPGQILSCYSVVTDMTLSGTVSHSKGGIAGKMINDASVIKGCYWQALTGITEAYGTKEDNGTVEGNASFADAAAANAAVDAMNTATQTGYDYKWQAGTNGSYPVLVPNSGN